jgi:hypothetical protein
VPVPVEAIPYVEPPVPATPAEAPKAAPIPVEAIPYAEIPVPAAPAEAPKAAPAQIEAPEVEEDDCPSRQKETIIVTEPDSEPQPEEETVLNAPQQVPVDTEPEKEDDYVVPNISVETYGKQLPENAVPVERVDESEEKTLQAQESTPMQPESAVEDAKKPDLVDLSEQLQLPAPLPDSAAPSLTGADSAAMDTSAASALSSQSILYILILSTLFLL